jgi:hypothetical protein
MSHSVRHPKKRVAVALLAVGVLMAAAFLTAQNTPTKLTPDEASKLGIEAYIYGYPLVTVEMTRRVATNVEKPDGLHAPMGQFANARKYPDATFKDVTAPNADTLYSSAFLDVSREPYVLSLPNVHGRYYLMPMLSGWTDVFQVPGTRTTGTDAQTYAITGPGWRGTLPQGITEYKSPTRMVWIIGRTYSSGTPEDYNAVHAIQDQYKLVPLSAYGKSYAPPLGRVDPNIDMKTPIRDQVNAMDAGQFFNTLARLMRDNPPTQADAPMVEEMKRLGIVSGQYFDIANADPAVRDALQGVPKAALEKITSHFKTTGEHIHGWAFTTQTGDYGTDYLQRAMVAFFGLGANRPQDAVYPTSETDANGTPYDGKNKYVIHFAKGQMPPVKAFWSVTMYNAEFFFVPNKLNRYTVSERNNLKANADGSTDIYIQKDSPGADKESNWLPAPAGKFVLMLRMYWPNEKPPSILDGSWKPPAVTLVSTPVSAVR